MAGQALSGEAAGLVFGLPVVELVQSGLLGFAVVVLALALRALLKLIELHRAHPTGRFLGLVATVITFIMVSASSIVLGVFSLVLEPDIEVVFDANPSEVFNYGSIVVVDDDETIKLRGGRSAPLTVKGSPRITIELGEIIGWGKALAARLGESEREVIKLRQASAGRGELVTELKRVLAERDAGAAPSGREDGA